MEDEKFFKEQIKDLLKEAVEKTFPEASDFDVKVEYPASEDHGEYASNLALALSKELKLPPREIAEKVIANLPANDLIGKTEIAGPGFINFFISKQVLDREVAKVIEEKDQYGSSKIGAKKRIVLDYSSPNIAKPLGIHHLLSTIIGQSLCNIFGALGFETISVNHIGDWGTQFGKLIYAYKNWGKKEIIEADPINELLKLYVKFHDEAEKNPEIEDDARKEFKIFEEGNKENKQLWEWFVRESMNDIEKTYDRLGGIHFDYTHGESFYENKMGAILDEGKDKGVFVEGDEGAYVVNFDDPDMPTVPVQKKDGTTLYITRDFATLKFRIDEWKPEKILYVVDIAQTLHFKQLFDASKKFPWYADQGVHVWFGRMHMKDKKMSTRKGNMILLNEVLDEGIDRAGKVIEEKNSDLKDKENVARVVGVGAIKYNILSQNRTTDITFDWDNMLSFDGNSGPYLQYTYARAKSILRKGDDVVEDFINDPDDADEKNKSVVRLFPKFAEQITLAASEYKPNIVSNYLYELAQKFNGFYNSVPVIKADSAEKREERLKVVEAAAQVLKNGLRLLGVEVVEEM